MKNVLVIVGLILLLIVFYRLYKQQTPFRGVDFPAPRAAQDTSSTRELVRALINTHEFFFGNISMRYLDVEKTKVEIIMMNENTGDDSIGAQEHYFVAEKKDEVWKITQSKLRWKCMGDLFFAQWTTKACS